MLKRLDHVGVIVDDLEEARRFLEGMGLELVRTIEAPDLGRRGAFYRCGDSQIEVIQDDDATVRSRRLEGRTARIEHIAIEVEDLAGTLAALEGLGVRSDSRGVVRVGTRNNVWTEPETSDGVMYQFVEDA